MAGALQRPPEEIISAIRTRIRDFFGVDMDPNALAMMIASMLDYEQTPTGIQWTCRRLGFVFTAGQEDVEYRLRDGMGNIRETVSPGSLGFATGVFYNGQPLNPNQLAMTQKEIHQCSDCQVRTHCTKKIVDYTNRREVYLCNHCMVNQPDVNLRNQGDRSLCSLQCPAATSCSHHPLRQERRLLEHTTYQRG